MDLTPAPKDVLDLPLDPSDSYPDATIRSYLVELLTTLWTKGEMFSGKRPLGSTHWQWDLYKPLVKAGFITGSIDEDGYLDEVDHRAGDRVIAAAIAELGQAPAEAVPASTEPIRDALARAISDWAKNPARRRGAVDLGDLLETAVMPVVADALADSVPAKPGDLVAGDAGKAFGFIVGTLVEDEIFNGLGHTAVRVEGQATPYAVEPSTVRVLKAGEAR